MKKKLYITKKSFEADKIIQILQSDLMRFMIQSWWDGSP